MSKPINPDVDNFPDYNVPQGPVGHSGNIGLEFPAEHQVGPLRETIPQTPDDVSTLVENTPTPEAPAVPVNAPQAPEKKGWSIRTKALVAGAVAVALTGVGIGVGVATAGGKKEDATAPSTPAATSSPFGPTSGENPNTSSINPDTNTAVIVDPTTPAETAPTTSAQPASPQQEATTSVAAPTSEAPTTVATPELPPALQKYVVSPEEAIKNSDGYWDGYAKQIGVEDNSVTDADQQQLEAWLQTGYNNIQISQFVTEKQGSNLTALANALIANPGLDSSLKTDMIRSIAKHWMFNTLPETLQNDPLLTYMEKTVQKVPKGSILRVSVNSWDPKQGMRLDYRATDAQTGAKTFEQWNDSGVLVPFSYSTLGANNTLIWTFQTH
jgi:hypothetical protein